MFLVEAKTAIVEALLATFNSTYPDDRFKSLWASIEYPVSKANYPGIWVDFIPNGPVRSMGIDHREYYDPLDPEQNEMYPITRFQFSGTISLTAVALTSLERDSLVDEIAKLLSFGKDNEKWAPFRAGLDTNDLINFRANWDEFAISGGGESPGTPWGSNEIVYEETVSLELEGDFAYVPAIDGLAILSQIVIYKWATPLQSDPTTPGGWI